MQVHSNIRFFQSNSFILNNGNLGRNISGTMAGPSAYLGSITPGGPETPGGSITPSASVTPGGFNTSSGIVNVTPGGPTTPVARLNKVMPTFTQHDTVEKVSTCDADPKEEESPHSGECPAFEKSALFHDLPVHLLETPRGPPPTEAGSIKVIVKETQTSGTIATSNNNPSEVQAEAVWEVDLKRILKLERNSQKLKDIIQHFVHKYYNDPDDWPAITNDQLLACGIRDGLLIRWRKVHSDPKKMAVPKPPNNPAITSVESISIVALVPFIQWSPRR